MIVWGRGLKVGIGAGIAALLAAFAFVYHQVALDQLADVAQRQNVVVARTLANTLLPRHAAVLLVPPGMPAAELKQRPEVAGLNAAVREMVRGTDVLKVKVYAPNGVTVYSSDAAQIGENKRDNEGFQRALLGETPSVLAHRDQMDAFDKTLSDLDVVATYVPYRGTDRAQSAVFEVYADVTALVAQARQRVWIVLGVLAAAIVAVGVGALALVRSVGDNLRKVEREAGERRVRHQAYHDALTGLPNRANFLEHLGESVSRAQRNGGRFAVFMIDIDRPGLSFALIEKLGTNTLSSCSVFFDDVRIEPHELVGTLHGGWFELLEVLNTERIVTTAALIGAGDMAIRQAVEYAQVRKVFRGTPIGAYQGVQFPLAQAHAQLQTARLMNLKAAWLCDQGRQYGSEANTAKLIAAQAAMSAIEHAMQTLGGMGYARESHLERLWRDARLFKFAPVAEEMVLNFIATHDLGLPRGY